MTTASARDDIDSAHATERMRATLYQLADDAVRTGHAMRDRLARGPNVDIAAARTALVRLRERIDREIDG